MPRRSQGRAGLALTGSLLLHASVLSGLVLTLSPWEFPPPPASTLEVELRTVTPAPAPVPRSASRLSDRAAAAPPPRQVARELAAAPPAAAKAETPADADDTGPPGDDDAASVLVGAAATAHEGEAARLSQQGVEPSSLPRDAADPAAPVLAARALPPRLELHYAVRYGLASGKQSLLWVNEGAGYTLSSVAEASGLAGVFYRGRFVQVSRGRLTAHGLQPEEFWDQRGDKRSSARFDAQQLTLLPARGAPRHFRYSGTAQDALSLFFQLALDAPAAPTQWGYTVFNGKKLREYRYASRGEVVLETALGPLRTLHLERVGEADGRFEAWLAIDRHYLPVRLLRQDEEGNTIELRVQTIAP